jgi:SulP family sulfate permease
VLSIDRLLPFLRWRRRVSRETLRVDLLAGLTGAVVVLPQGVAFATIAGLPPQYGLYAGMIPAIIAALFGSSWHLVSGPTTAASIVLFSVLSARAIPGSAEYIQLALTLTLMVGAIQLALGTLRLGALVNFISHSVIVGFTAGAALLIAASQLGHFLGLQLAREPSAYQTLSAVLGDLSDVHFYSLLVGGVTIAAGLAAKRYVAAIPNMLLAMLAGGLCAALIEWVADATTGLAYVPTIPAALPPLSMPLAPFDAFVSLAPAAVAVTLFALTEAVGIARSLAIRSGQHLDGNQEFIGQGLSNIVGSFFSSYVATGSFNRSALNYQSGARTPVAAILAGLLLMGLVLVVAPLVSYLPTAAMAGLLFLVAWGLVDTHHIGKILKSSRPETLVMLTTFLTAVFVDLEFAILLGVILSLFLYLLDATRPRIVSRVPDPRLPKRGFNTDPALPECPQFKMVRLDGSLFFGAVHHVQKMLRIFEQRNPEQKHLMILASGVNTIDVSGAEFLAQEARYRRSLGGSIYLYRAKEGVLSLLRAGGYLQDIGEDNFFRSKQQAIAHVISKLDHDVCRNCTKRIFTECESLAEAK